MLSAVSMSNASFSWRDGGRVEGGGGGADGDGGNDVKGRFEDGGRVTEKKTHVAPAWTLKNITLNVPQVSEVCGQVQSILHLLVLPIHHPYIQFLCLYICT